MPSITDGVERFFFAATGVAFTGLLGFECMWCLTGCSGLITGTAAGALELCPSSRNPAPKATTAVIPAATKIRARRLTFVLSAVARLGLNKRKGAVSRALSQVLQAGLAAAGLDVAGRAGLVVRRGAGDRVPDAVAAECRDRDLDVLDPGVIRRLELGQRHSHVTRRMVGVVRLHPRHGGADVRLRGRVVRPATEAEVRRDRDCQQDPEDDDDDEEFDQRETAIVSRQALPHTVDHSFAPSA